MFDSFKIIWIVPKVKPSLPKFIKTFLIIHNQIFFFIKIIVKTTTFTLSPSGKSCDDACIEKQKRCRSGTLKTLNSIYLFKKAHWDCHNVETNSNGASYWNMKKQPLIRSDSYCTGFVNVASYDCEEEPANNERRLCHCSNY